MEDGGNVEKMGMERRTDSSRTANQIRTNGTALSKMDGGTKRLIVMKQADQADETKISIK